MFVPIIATVFTFGGLLLGGAIGFITKQLTDQKIYILYTCSGGILLGLLVFELIPELFIRTSSFGPYVGVGIGILLMVLLDICFHHSAETAHSQNTIHMFSFLSVAIAIHNFPTGLALGVAFENHLHGTSILLLAIIFHHIPEGLTLIIPFLFTRFKLYSFVITSLVLSITLGIGTVIGSTVNTTEPLLSIIMGMAAGSIGYVAIHEMLWKARYNLSISSILFYALLGAGIVRVYIHIFM